uniref:mS109 n=1 Tax=Polytomella magna TaxID=353565 RepID=UPI002240E422|nr:Chain Yc, mS109 [Polytomella magna]8APN_Yc Chain Yc, mS109 [Polytomella magna]8APO_Yc Chain Yc, mS109 [Polytomella magna]
NNPEDNIAIRNAPQKVFQLIGDPRSGVADDVTHNPFGEITVEMVWHQLKNEVYWYRYEFAGQTTEQSHRDSRLSDYTKNLIYLLRAKNPRKWTIEALAEKFHIRKQRVLAILALKEMEAHKIESGKQLQGPLSPYGLKVRVEDLKLLSLDPTGCGWVEP